MSKIVLIALIISAISCQNFLAAPQPGDIGHLVEQFLDGLQLFKGLPHELSCIAPDDQIIGDVLNIVDTIKHFDKDQIIPILEGIVGHVMDIYKNVKIAVPECQAWKDEVVGQFKKIGTYVSDKDYITKLATHMVFGLNTIKDDITVGIDAWNNGDYPIAGKKFGDVIHFIFFWDFK